MTLFRLESAVSVSAVPAVASESGGEGLGKVPSFKLRNRSVIRAVSLPVYEGSGN